MRKRADEVGQLELHALLAEQQIGISTYKLLAVLWDAEWMPSL